MNLPANLQHRLVAHVAEGRALKAAIARTIRAAEAQSEDMLARSLAATAAGDDDLADRLDERGNRAHDRAEALRAVHDQLDDATDALEGEMSGLAVLRTA